MRHHSKALTHMHPRRVFQSLHLAVQVDTPKPSIACCQDVAEGETKDARHICQEGEVHCSGNLNDNIGGLTLCKAADSHASGCVIRFHLTFGSKYPSLISFFSCCPRFSLASSSRSWPSLTNYYCPLRVRTKLRGADSWQDDAHAQRFEIDDTDGTPEPT